MICPNCNAENELTWRRYFMSPLGRHLCTHCQAKFSMVQTPKYYLVIFGAWFVIAIIVFYGADYFGLDRLRTYLIYLVLGSAITFPLDKKFDNSWRPVKLRQ